MREYDLLNHQLISGLMALVFSISIGLFLLIGVMQEDEPEPKPPEELSLQDAYRSLVIIARECIRYNDNEFPNQR